MLIGYSQLDSDSEFGYGHDESNSKIGDTKSTICPIAKAWDCPIFCRKDSRVLVLDLAFRNRRLTLVSHDVFLRQP